jgi:ADP-ribose pyrophosphatase
VDLGIEQVALPNGHDIALEVVRHPGGAAVAAVDGENRVCVLRQYRHAAGGWIWEVPAGKLDPGEAPFATAERELAEEAGLAARSWSELGRLFTTPGFCDEVIHLYLARDLRSVPARRGAHELIEIHWLGFAEALDQAQWGEIQDAKTVAVLFRASRLLGLW